MVTKDALKRYHGYLQRTEKNSDVNDTIGAICLDSNGLLVAGVSSGGIPLKLPGRVGDSAIFGSGCWAENVNGRFFGCSTTGKSSCNLSKG
jgi:taspase, threonine aspartase, 1